METLQNGHFSCRLYSKPIRSNTIHPWDSHSPISLKRGILIGELRRAVHRSTPDYETYSTNKVIQRFLVNGYPKSFVNRVYKYFRRKQTHHQTKREETNKIYLKCPYVSEEMKRKMINVMKRTGLNDKVFLSFTNYPLKRHFRPPKEKIHCDESCITCQSASSRNTCHVKGVIYRVTCNLCKKIYIGETERMVKSRIKEHLNIKNETSHVVLHSKKEHQNKIDITWTILHAQLKNKAIRKKLEALYISKHSRDELLNGCSGSRLLIY